jgi:hypothetical protein
VAIGSRALGNHADWRAVQPIVTADWMTDDSEIIIGQKLGAICLDEDIYAGSSIEPF